MPLVQSRPEQVRLKAVTTYDSLRLRSWPNVRSEQQLEPELRLSGIASRPGLTEIGGQRETGDPGCARDWRIERDVDRAHVCDDALCAGPKEISPVEHVEYFE